MEPICNDFNFPNPENVGPVVAPLLMASEQPGEKTLIRAMLVTNADIVEGQEPVMTMDADGNGEIVYETTEPSRSQQHNLVWYLEETIDGVFGTVTVDAKDNRLPPQTSRGTQTTVQSGGGNTIDV